MLTLSHSMSEINGYTNVKTSRSSILQ